MKYSDTELRGLVARAMPLGERWHARIEPSASESEIAHRLQKWREAFSVEGDPGLLARRLAFDGLNLQTCRSRLGSFRLVEDYPLPSWAVLLNTLLERCAAAGVIWPPSVAGPTDEPLPFWEVWVPFVAGATAEIRTRADNTLSNLTENVLRGFQQQLLGLLGKIAALSLGLEFRRFLVKHDPSSIFDWTSQKVSPSHDFYRRFVCELQSGGLLEFFQKYAVLARLMPMMCAYWADHVAEFCQRLDEDRPALAKLFNHGNDLGPVIQVDLGMSDPHHCHRAVVISKFASGTRIVYKPKDLGVDKAYWSVIDWINSQICSANYGGAANSCQGGLLPLRTMMVLDRTTHGWVEFVEHEECKNTNELEQYYLRIGILLCVAYILGSSDFHLDNIIANGEHPVLIDLESMMQPLPCPWDARLQNSADQRVAEIMHQSVLRTGLLPFWIVSNPGKSYDVSGIGADQRSDTGYTDACWDEINTDQMKLVYRGIDSDPGGNRPELNGQVVSAEDYVAEIVEGFTAMYRFLLDRRDVLLQEGGPLSLFHGLKLRCLLRMTKVYGQISERRMHPEFLRDGADSSIELERLARDFLAIDPDPNYPPPWGVYRAELLSLERLDIPYFSFLSNSDALLADERVVAPAFFSQSGLDYVATRLRQMGENDLQVQLSLIRTSLHARYVGRPSDRTEPPSASAKHTTASIEKAEPPKTRAELIAAAVAIADEIRNSAICGADGGATWISLAFDPQSERMQLQPMTDNLYDGRVGVAMFLAALEHVTGGAGFRDLAYASIFPLRKALRHPTPVPTGLNTLGGASGLGGQLYALVRIGGWLGDEELLDLARRSARWFIPKRIAHDKSFDIFGGVAGGILGLLALSEADADGDALNSAVECGDHLLKNRVVANTGYRAWPGGWVPRPLAGFSHGAAGIAYALSRLSQKTGQPRFQEAAAEGIAYETSVYSRAARNWPDFREPEGQDGQRFMVAWCNGATGVGLARLGGLVGLDSPSIRDDISHALETTRATPDFDADHLCCGNAGRIDFIFEVGKQMGRPELVAEAQHRTSVILRAAARNGGYALHAQAPNMPANPAFFQGTAGIGYTFLRLAATEHIPCALLWQ